MWFMKGKSIVELEKYLEWPAKNPTVAVIVTFDMYSKTYMQIYWKGIRNGLVGIK